MNLLIDSGNSFIKWAQQTDGVLAPGGRCHSHAATSLHDIWSGDDAPARVLIANVAGESIASEISNIVKDLWHIEAEFVVSSRNCCGLSNSYHNPAQLGIDRWMAMVAAFKSTSGPVIVVDCGTAVTIDLVNEKGQFLGGVILPGLNTAYHSLRAGTVAVEEINSINQGVSPVAQSTEDGVVTGVLLGLVGGIERVIHEQSSQLDQAPVVLLTGGDAETLLPYLTLPAIIQPDLVLEGLGIFGDEQ